MSSAADNAPARDAVAAVVVLYNSPPDCLENLNAYRRQVQNLYIIDNSPVSTEWALAAFCDDASVVYWHFPQNVGMATALNTAARRAINDGFAHLLTMDDDSRAPADLVQTMLRYLTTVPAGSVGLVSPKHVLTTAPPARSDGNQTPRPVLTTMTSGNLLSLRAYERVGPFRDDLFIDVVDHEYNLRLNARGYRVIELPNLYLTHELGAPKRIPFTRLRSACHSPVRNYYLIRNSFVVARLHGRTFPRYIVTAATPIAVETAKICLFEDQKPRRLRLVVKALADALRGRLGPLNAG